MSTPFTIALTADFNAADGTPRYRDIGTDLLDAADGVSYRYLDQHHPELSAAQLADSQGVIVLTPKVTAASLSKSQDLLAVGRFGVGYDGVDVAACTANDVCLFITAGAVDRPVAEATVMWMLALGHRLRAKDELARAGGWDARSGLMGGELRDRTLGLVGCGGIARSVLRLLAGWGMQTPLVFDPFLKEEQAEELGVRVVDLDTLLAESDYVSIHCPLTDSTRGLIGAAQLQRMRESAYLINTARGGIVDEAALDAALREGQIAGAALDCFESEPLQAPPRFADLDNVLMAPHSIAWTNELFRDIGRYACQGMIDLAEGRRPHGVINPEVFERPGFQAKWQRLANKEVQA
ncbi:MAG: NAD(P)-dependent oxidoreductase [Planctomycetota bacterium]